jgi:hypothetical protein
VTHFPGETTPRSARKSAVNKLPVKRLVCSLSEKMIPFFCWVCLKSCLYLISDISDISISIQCGINSRKSGNIVPIFPSSVWSIALSSHQNFLPHSKRGGELSPFEPHINSHMPDSQLIEETHKFKRKGMLEANERKRWHGTRRECLVGDPGPNATQMCDSKKCSLCIIMKKSFDVDKCRSRCM